MDALLKVVQTINLYLSDYILIAMLVVAGLFFTIKTRFVQIRCFGEGMKRVFGGFSLKGGKQKGKQTGGVGICAHTEALDVIAGGQKAPGKGDDGQVGTEHRRIGHAQGGGRGHGVIQSSLHHQTGNRQTGTGNNGRQHPGDPDIPNDPGLSRCSLAQQGRPPLRNAHIRGAQEQANAG